MAKKQEIEKAIGAHGMWKTRLKTMIDSGKTDIPVETIRTDNNCDFGKWLYGATLSNQDKTSPLYKKVKDLHAQFHQKAGQVAALAVSGKKSDATNLMNGDYGVISTQLTQAMIEWNKSGT